MPRRLQKAAMFAGQTKETHMRLFTLYELIRLPTVELLALKIDVERRLAEGVRDRILALENLRLICRALSLRECIRER
ncbi:MAG: hypothetical protein JSS66_17095 [Armatimonadetes bacterium]|nr:hypothetical protein [Armatimonadota bacterium]